MSPRDILLALAVVVVWGSNFVAVKWGVAEVPPLLLSGLRYVIAVLPVIFFIKRPQVSIWLMIAYGFTVGVGQFGFLFTAIKLGMPAGLSSLVLQVQVFFSIGLAVVFLGERPTRSSLVGAVIAFAGIAVIAVERLQGAALAPLLMTLAAAVSWSLANLVTKSVGGKNVDMLAFVVWSCLVPPIPLFILSYLIEGPGAVSSALANITWLGGGSLLFTAWLSTIFGYGAWSYLFGRYPASTVVPFALLVPIVGIGASALLLREQISRLEAIGSLLVFAGLLLNVFGPRLLPRRIAT
jgi:O-acetylserine/cysteine efflux transporter